MYTLGGIGRLVVVAEVLQVLVLDPGDPVLVLLVVLLLCPLHVCWRIVLPEDALGLGYICLRTVSA